MDVFSAVSATLKLLEVARDNMGRARRMGRTIDDLRDLLSELLELENYVDPDEDIDFLNSISTLIDEVMVLIKKNRNTGRVAMTFSWNSKLEEEVTRTNARLAAIHRRWIIRKGFGKGNDRFLKEDHVPEIKKSPAQSPYLGATSPSLKARRASVQVEATDAIYLPTTLTLHDENGDVIRSLVLERLCILERNVASSFRIIQYESSDGRTTVTHEIPFRTIPATPQEVDPEECYFLKEQVLTVETDEEYVVYHLYPTYTFKTAPCCDEFMSQVRERDLIATFLPLFINTQSASSSSSSPWRSLLCLMGGSPSTKTLLARSKHVRIWMRTMPSDTTMTFLDRTNKPPGADDSKTRFSEWPLREFDEAALVTEKDVELSWRNHGDLVIFSFRDQAEAREFAATFQRYTNRRGSAAQQQQQAGAARYGKA